MFRLVWITDGFPAKGFRRSEFKAMRISTRDFYLKGVFGFCYNLFYHLGAFLVNHQEELLIVLEF